MTTDDLLETNRELARLADDNKQREVQARVWATLCLLSPAAMIAAIMFKIAVLFMGSLLTWLCSMAFLAGITYKYRIANRKINRLKDVLVGR